MEMIVDKKVSVIVPIYNVEYYLTKCMKTIINQTYENLDIILVDDGSTDKSPQIADSWEKKDSRIKVIHKHNGGVSSARNIGLTVAAGEYVMFVDADDWLPENSVELLVANCEKYKSDFCFGSAVGIGVINNEKYGENGGFIVDVNDGNNFLRFSSALRTELGPWAKLYRLSIINDNNIMFQDGVSYGEDRLFIWNYIRYCKTVSSISECVYKYSQLNLTRACGKYYRQVDLWLSEAVASFFCLFSAEFKIGNEELLEILLKQFMVCCKHHYELFSTTCDDNKKLIEQLRRTAESFSSLLKQISPLNKSILSNIQKEFLSLLESQSGETIYSFLASHTSLKTSNGYNKGLRNILVKIKRFIVYRLFVDKQ